MLTLPFELMNLIVAFAPLFSKPVWKHVQVLLVSAIMAPGKRTVTSAWLCTKSPNYVDILDSRFPATSISWGEHRLFCAKLMG
jgi:hypothetical protein